MSLRLRLFLAVLVVLPLGGFFLGRWAMDEVRPRYLESMEESLVDVAVLLASLLESSAPPEGAAFDAEPLRAAFAGAYRREFSARVYGITKTSIDLRVTVTDGRGRVVFDSENGRDEGRDYSRWNDVRRTLAGNYGARATRLVPDDESSLVIHVAAPVRRRGEIVGVVSVGKPTRNVNALVRAAQRRLLLGASAGGAAILVALLVVGVWLTQPLEKLTAYARAVRDGRPARPPPLAGRTFRELGAAFEEMRDALEGKQYVERYTQALTHEIKAPLSAIRGAAELLAETPPPEERRRFLENIRGESVRLQTIVDRLLQLSALEARKTPLEIASVDPRETTADVFATFSAAAAAREVALLNDAPAGLRLRGERFLLRQALSNLVQNALDFSPSGGVVRVSAAEEGTGRLAWSVEDDGPGVPDYARGRIFERFYSLPRPGTGKKSTGLGLSFVREIAHLHGGEIRLEPRSPHGTRAVLTLPA